MEDLDGLGVVGKIKPSDGDDRESKYIHSGMPTDSMYEADKECGFMVSSRTTFVADCRYSSSLQIGIYEVIGDCLPESLRS
jgi:hypothetical protein